jgi:hypothetical protein
MTWTRMTDLSVLYRLLFWNGTKENMEKQVVIIYVECYGKLGSEFPIKFWNVWYSDLLEMLFLALNVLFWPCWDFILLMVLKKLNIQSLWIHEYMNELNLNAKFHVSERYHALDTKTKSNPLSLEEVNIQLQKLNYLSSYQWLIVFKLIFSDDIDDNILVISRDSKLVK